MSESRSLLKPVSWVPNPGPQTCFLASDCREVLYGGAVGGGKLCRIDEPVPTPFGWSTIGRLKSGDVIFTELGKPCKVLQVHPITENVAALRLTFDDGTQIEADAKHRWLTFNGKELAQLTRLDPEWRARRRATRPKRVSGRKSAKFTESLSRRNSENAKAKVAIPIGGIRTTEEIANTLLMPNGRQRNHAIPLAAALDLSQADLALDPYLLGVWLGDGTTLAGQITSMDYSIIEAYTSQGFKLGSIQHREGNQASAYSILGLRTKLKTIGVFGNKHIPMAYLRASTEQRLALLQGLMDTDGTVAEGGSPEFTSTLLVLAQDVLELILSLGWKASIREDRAKLYGIDHGPCYTIKWKASEIVFRLARKKALQKLSTRRVTKFRYIVSAERVPSSPMRCITVDNPTGLFLISRSMVPTHNSDAIVALPLGRVWHSKHRSIILRRTRPELQEIIDRTIQFYPEVVPGAVWREAESRWKFPSGAMVQMGYAEHEKDIYDFKCLTPEHDVLTPLGWEKIENIEQGDEVVSWSKDGKLSWQKVQASYCYKFDGELVEADEQVSFAMTPNHRLLTCYRKAKGLTEWKWREAQELNHSNMVVPVAGEGLQGTKETKSGDWLELLGWYIAEGIDVGGPRSNRLRISQVKPEGREKIIKLAQALDLKMNVREREIVLWWDIPECGQGAKNKFIPRELLWEKDAQRLLDGLMGGDGFENNYTTISPQLADDVQELGIRLGYHCSKRKYEPKEKGEDFYVIRLMNRKVCAIPKTTRVPYSGPVYCICVEPAHTFLIRRNGYVHVTGNSFEYDLICFDELTSFTEKMYLFMMLRNRTKSKDLPPRLRAGTNPGDIGHDWVFTRFIDGKVPYKKYDFTTFLEGTAYTTSRQFIPSLVWDNLALPDPVSYVAGILELSPEDVAAYLHGDWTKLAGAMFRTPIKVADRNELLDPKDFFVVRSIDFGIDDPTVVHWSVFYPKHQTIDIVSELYLKGATLDGIVHLIKEREKEMGMGQPTYSVGSPEMQNRQATSNQSIASMMTTMGVPVERGNTDRMAGWARIQNLIQRGTLRAWPGGYGPWGAQNLLKTLPKLQRNTGLGKDPNDLRPRQDDHSADSIRYAVMALFELASAIVKPQIEEDNSNRDMVFDKMRIEMQKTQKRNWIPDLGEW